MLEVSWKRNGCHFNCHFSIQHTIRPTEPLKQTSASWDNQLISQAYKAAKSTIITVVQMIKLFTIHQKFNLIHYLLFKLLTNHKNPKLQIAADRSKAFNIISKWDCETMTYKSTGQTSMTCRRNSHIRYSI